MLRTSSAYRADIDGLRGLAVATVVLFHVGFNHMSGAFVTLDVFFVVSGFLITRNLLSDLQAETFTLPRFYARRARRLFPALFFTLVLTFVGALMLFTPEHVRLMAKSTVYALGSLANVYFWQDSDYFSTAAELKPLLHTWSLAVEEQFYMLWPCVLFLLARRGRLSLVWPLAVLVCVGSLFLSEYWLTHRQDAAAYYLTPSRAFEFAIGALCVKWVEYKPRSPWLLEALFLLGLIAIALPVITYNPHTSFPGLHALAPCLGSAALIYAGRAKYLGRLLDNPVSVGLGLISYSLYLAHWPLLVFFRYYKLHALDFPQQVALVAVSVLVAVAMYRFVEQPFRAGRTPEVQLSPGAFGLRCAGLSLAFGLVAASAWQNIGWSLHYPAEIASMLDARALWQQRQTAIRSEHCHFYSREQTWEQYVAGGDACLEQRTDQPNILVAGDSQAADLWAALRIAYPGVNFLQATGNSCRPVVGPRESYDGHCEPMRGRIDQALHSVPKLDGMVLSARWRASEFEGFMRELRRYQGFGIPLLVVGPSPQFELELPVLISRYGRLDGLEEFANEFRVPERSALSARLQAAVSEQRVPFLDRNRLVCGDGMCPVFDDAYEVLFTDVSHWSVAGHRYVARRLAAAYPQVSDLFR